MISAFCPAHITCFFRPVRSQDIMRTGSRGAGIRLSLGTTVHMDETSGRTRVVINGKDNSADVTRHVLEHMAPDRGFDVGVTCDLPMGQGFGMSASGAIAAALCAAEITGKSRDEAFAAAHAAEVMCGGGLGDAAGLMSEADVPIRVREGMPPFGDITDAGFSFGDMTLAVMGRKMNTADVLGDGSKLEIISAAGDIAIRSFLAEMTKESLFKVSGRFSSETGLRAAAVSGAIEILDGNGISSAMCMLGNSIFINASKKEVEGILDGRAHLYGTASTAEPARIIRRG